MVNKIAVVAAIVIIIVIAVLLLGFPLGFYNSGNLIGTSQCVAAPGYICSNPVLHNGNLTLTIGQAIGLAWTQANIFVVNGSQVPSAVPPLPCEEGFSVGISSGQRVNVILAAYSNQNTCAGFTRTAGQAFYGTVWAGYRTSVNSTETLARIGTLAVKST